MIKASSAKAKGTRLEVAVTAMLNDVPGVTARRQPGSGIYSAFPHDVEAVINGKRYIIECKQRKEGFKQLNGWIGAADLLVLRVDRGEPYVYMTMNAFQSIVGEQDDE